MAKGESIFRFKQFDVIHGNGSMKVGTDALLLGAWVNVDDCERILDIGTGCGVIALMLAQNNQLALIDAIDIDEKSIEEAKKNFNNSNWNSRLNAHNIDLQSYIPLVKYDHIVSNPPFFTDGTSSPVEQRHSARHMNKLSFEELLKHSKRLLNGEGKLSLIIPENQAEHCIDQAYKNNLKLYRKLVFYPKKESNPERCLLTFIISIAELEIKEETLIHYNELNEWTEDYKTLTKEFHIKL